METYIPFSVSCGECLGFEEREAWLTLKESDGRFYAEKVELDEFLDDEGWWIDMEPGHGLVVLCPACAKERFCDP